MKKSINLFMVLLLAFSIMQIASAQSGITEELEYKVRKLIDSEQIPGAALIVVEKGKSPYIKSFGYKNLEESIPMDANSSFQLSSATQPLTSMAILKLIEEGKLSLETKVSSIFPLFSVNFAQKSYNITIEQLLNHTSGIPWAISLKMPPDSSEQAIKSALKSVLNSSLAYEPGSTFEFSEMNYIILGAIIEKITGKSYKAYMEEDIFPQLNLNKSWVGVVEAPEEILSYSKGLFSTKRELLPLDRSREPTSLIFSTPEDIAGWLGQLLSEDKIIEEGGFTTSGWYRRESGRELYQAGTSTGFSTYIIINQDKDLAIALLANANTIKTYFIGNTVYKELTGLEGIDFSDRYQYKEYIEIASSILYLLIWAMGLALLAIITLMIFGRRKIEIPPFARVKQILYILFVYGLISIILYIIPNAAIGISWKGLYFLTPEIIVDFIRLIAILMGVSFTFISLYLLFPAKNNYIQSLPIIFTVSLFLGLFGLGQMFVIMQSFYTSVPKLYLLIFFSICLLISATGDKVMQTKMITLANKIVYECRMKLLNRLFSVNYQKFEKLETGRIYTTLNDDTEAISGAAGTMIGLITDSLTVIGIFAYIFIVSPMTALFLIIITAFLSGFYTFISAKTTKHFERSRDIRNKFMGLLDGLVKGFKELSMHKRAKKEYAKDIEGVSTDYKNVNNMAHIKFVNAEILVDSFLMILLASIGIILPMIVTNIDTTTIISFIILMLYIIEPISNLMDAVPEIMQLRVSWNRIQGLLNELPGNWNMDDKENDSTECKVIEQLEAKNLEFAYNSENEHESFKVGPISLEASRGEIIFIIGGNGSGKTTISKLLTGLYIPEMGSLTIDGREVTNEELGEYYSTVFSDFYLFEKLYNIDVEANREKINRYLKLLELDDKVSIKDGEFSTIDLSGGQRKRLALLRCYIEDRPIYLFDEWAADQDPTFRKFFYNTLLVKMKEEGKIVIAVTHDDHYFNIADKIIKLDMGKIDYIKSSEEEKEPSLV